MIFSLKDIFTNSDYATSNFIDFDLIDMTLPIEAVIYLGSHAISDSHVEFSDDITKEIFSFFSTLDNATYLVDDGELQSLWQCNKHNRSTYTAFFPITDFKRKVHENDFHVFDEMFDFLEEFKHQNPSIDYDDVTFDLTFHRV
ncbi:hypothetical protein [Photobacterium leiognathi]|uniref:hypothetical protein n=1 Tax=Photobacterium leiognathi TaxID=553611 RepID=UPI00298104D4|nr:hypothetical protein [Photobacterium leiognathi]